MVLGLRHVDRHVHHVEVGIAESRIVEHDRRDAELVTKHLSYVASLFFQLSNSALRGSLAFINQACRNLDRNLVDRWTELLLQKQLRSVGLLEDRNYSYAIDLAVCWTGWTLGSFPCSFAAERVSVVNPENSLVSLEQ